MEVDGDVYVEVGDLALTHRPSTPHAHVQADVHVNVHVVDDVSVDVNVNLTSVR